MIAKNDPTNVVERIDEKYEQFYQLGVGQIAMIFCAAIIISAVGFFSFTFCVFCSIRILEWAGWLP